MQIPSDKSPSERTYTTKHGKPSTMKTGNIGKPKESTQFGSVKEIFPEPSKGQTRDELGKIAGVTPQRTEERHAMALLKADLTLYSLSYRIYYESL